MESAAFGIRAHSGWAALVALSHNPSNLQVLDRRRIVTVDPDMAGGSQPYHFARGQKLPEAEKHLADCAAVSERLAYVALGSIVKELRDREYAVAGCAVLLASGRPLPALSEVLASHPLIHTAEGEFFRTAFWKAGERLKIPVTGIRERDLPSRAQAVFGSRSSRLLRDIATLGGALGPPWTADQKTASLAACVVLAGASAKP